MSFHFVRIAGTFTFSFCCLLLGQLSSEAKSLPIPSPSSPISPSNTTTAVDDLDFYNGTTFSSSLLSSNFTSFSTFPSTGNDSLESLMEDSSSEVDVENKTLLSLEDDTQQSSLLSSNIDHNSNNASLVEESLELEGMSTDASDTVEMGSGNNDTMSGNSEGSGESGFGSNLISAIQGMFHFNKTNVTNSNNSTGNGWTADPTGAEIQALMFA